MAGKLTRDAYQILIDQNLHWLKRAIVDAQSAAPGEYYASRPSFFSLEYKHIVEVLKRSVKLEYEESRDSLRAQVLQLSRKLEETQRVLQDLMEEKGVRGDMLVRGIARHVLESAAPLAHRPEMVLCNACGVVHEK